MLGAAGDVVVGLIVHEKFGTVGFTQDDGAGAAEAGDRGGVGGGAVFQTQAAAAIGGKPGHIEAVLDGDRNAVKWTRRL